MSNIPIKNQRLRVDPVEQIESKIVQGNVVSGDELRCAIEAATGRPLTDRLRAIVCKFSVAAVKRRGRPGGCRGREDFAMEEMDAEYARLLQKYEESALQRRDSAATERTVLARAEQTPSELAYRKLLEDMQAYFPNIDWKALRNKHSAWKTGHFHSTEDCVDSEDFDAEIERQFPAPPPS